MLLSFLDNPTGYVQSVEQNKIEDLDGTFDKLSLGIRETGVTVHENIHQDQIQLDRINSIHSRRSCDIPAVTARDVVLKRCKQIEPICFEDCYPTR